MLTLFQESLFKEQKVSSAWKDLNQAWQFLLDESVKVVADAWSTNTLKQRPLERLDFLDESALGKSGLRAGCLMIHSYAAADQQTVLNCIEMQRNYDAHCIALYLPLQSNSNLNEASVY